MLTFVCLVHFHPRLQKVCFRRLSRNSHCANVLNLSYTQGCTTIRTGILCSQSFFSASNAIATFKMGSQVFEHSYAREPIAIVGSGCRFPGGASSPSKLWDLLEQPRDIVREIPPSRFNTEGLYHQDSQYHGVRMPSLFSYHPRCENWLTMLAEHKRPPCVPP